MSEMISVLPDTISTAELHGYLLGTIGPRPIALASTMDAQGRPNLSPFSFFNVFSTRPPILIFSPSRRVRDKSTKHTLQNVLSTKEVVINMVNYNMVQQTSLSSTEYGEGENEFIKAGFTMLKSDTVGPFRVAESPVQFECKVIKVEPLGEDGGAGNLIFSEVVKIHINSAVLDANGEVDQHKMDLVSRMGGNWYSRATQGLFEVPKPVTGLGMGIDQIPERIRLSEVLTGNDLGMLGNMEQLPSKEEVADFIHSHHEIRAIISADDPRKLHLKAQEYLHKKDVLSAWKVLLSN